LKNNSRTNANKYWWYSISYHFRIE
jgi:hypothetical protein